MDMSKTTQPDLAAFTEEVMARMRERYAGCEVKIVDIGRNNGISLTGLIIQTTDSCGEISILSTAYLNELYREYLESATVDMIAAHFAAYHEAAKGQGAFLVPDIQHFDEVRDIICYRLVNAALNGEYLKEIPHRLFLDLAMVYGIPLTGEDGRQGVIAVTNEHVGRWQVDEKTIHACAVANTERLYPAEIRRWVIPDGKVLNVNSGLFILRNKVGNGGAGAMFNQDILREFSGEYGDFYIIPFSICEVLLLPVAHAPGYVTKESLPRMVRQVNEHNIFPENVLSNNAYLYHAGTREIEILS